MFRLLISIFIIAVAMPMAFGATKKRITDPDEALQLAREAYLDYDVEQAGNMFDEYTALMKKKRRTVPEEVEAEMERLVMMENMMSRVERITVVDSLVVDADGFFRHYKLSPEAGYIVSGEAIRMPDVEMAFVPQNNSEMLYAEADVDGNFVLMGADVLDDGTVDHPVALEGDNLGGGGNAEYPFLMSDGITLYYANDGEGSIGGYDIFMTRRDDDGSFLQPQNVGMPYNSPYDDYLLAIDETTGAGWWATDRNRIPGKLTIYIFEPSETRVNVDADDENIVSLARLDDIALTQQGKNIDEVKRRINAISTKSPQQKSKATEFELAVGSANRIYRSLDDFRSARARSAMARAIDARSEMQRVESRLDDLRQQWRKGQRNQGVTILNLEQQLEDARQRYKQEVNNAIEEELKTIK